MLATGTNVGSSNGSSTAFEFSLKKKKPLFFANIIHVCSSYTRE